MFLYRGAGVACAVARWLAGPGCDLSSRGVFRGGIVYARLLLCGACVWKKIPPERQGRRGGGIGRPPGIPPFIYYAAPRALDDPHPQLSLS